MKPKVSIITPCYNRLEYTIRCYNSVKRTNPDFNYEHIIVDGGSWDGTQQWVKSVAFLNTDWWGKMKYVRYDRNLGCHEGRSMGLTHAEGDYIFMLDNDVELRKDSYLEDLCMLYDYLAEHENCGSLQGKRSGVRIVIELQNPHLVLDSFTVGEVWYNPMPFYRRDIVPRLLSGWPKLLPYGRKAFKTEDWRLIHMDDGTMKERGFDFGDQMHKYPDYFKTKESRASELGEDKISQWVDKGEE